MKEAEFFSSPPPADDKLPPKKKAKEPAPKIEVASSLPAGPVDPDDPAALIRTMLGQLDGVEIDEGGVDRFLHNTTLRAQRAERLEARKERQAKRGKKRRR